jgi:hypothetical protein
MYEDHHLDAMEAWSIALQEEYFIASYFARVPLEVLAAILSERQLKPTAPAAHTEDDRLLDKV